MSSADPAFIGTPITAAVTAVLTIAQAVPAIDKRLARVHELESQLGRLPRFVTRAYVWMQQVYKWGLIAITVAGIAMVLAFIFPRNLSHPMFVLLRNQGLTLVAAWLVLGAAMYTNILSRIVIWVRRPLSRLFGQQLDDHPAWHALWAFVDLNEGAKPLIINDEAVVRFANSIVGMLQTSATTSNRALPPTRPSEMNIDTYRSQIGNALLAGCVIEEAHSLLRLPRRDWTPFYDAIGKLAIGSELFQVKTVLTQHNSNAYYDSLAQGLNQQLELLGQEAVPEAAELKNRLKQAFNTLARDYGGDARLLHHDGKRLEVAYKRVAALPAPKDEGMQANFVKLGVVWGVWRDVPRLSFKFPFSKQVAAVLLDRGVILAPDDVKTLAFDHSRERQVQRAAVRLVIDHAIRLIEVRRKEQEKWLPTPSLTASGENFRWWVTYELDYRLWDYGVRLHNNCTGGDALSNWQYGSGQVIRMKKT